MADDWEQEDWEAEDFTPQLPATAAAKAAGLDQYETAGQALLAKATEPDMSKFEDEDQQEPEEETSYHIKPQVCINSSFGAQLCMLFGLLLFIIGSMKKLHHLDFCFVAILHHGIRVGTILMAVGLRAAHLVQ